MRKRMIGSLLSLTVLWLLAGCKYKANTMHVFRGPDGSLVAGAGENRNKELTWRLSDPKLTQFWIKFDQPDLCKGAVNGVLGSDRGKITCVIDSGQTGPFGYRIFPVDPNRQNPVGPLPPVMYLYVGGPWGCPGC